MSAMLAAEVEAQRCDAVHVSDLVRAQRRLDWLGAMRRGPQELARIQTEFVRRLGGRGSKSEKGGVVDQDAAAFAQHAGSRCWE